MDRYDPRGGIENASGVVSYRQWNALSAQRNRHDSAQPCYVRGTPANPGKPLEGAFEYERAMILLL